MLAIHSRGEALSVRAMYLAVQSLFNVPEDAQISDLAIEWEQNGMVDVHIPYCKLTRLILTFYLFFLD